MELVISDAAFDGEIADALDGDPFDLGAAAGQLVRAAKALQAIEKAQAEAAGDPQPTAYTVSVDRVADRLTVSLEAVA